MTKTDIPDPTNTILYGPPGTGKTYSVVLKAMSIINGETYDDHISGKTYADLKAQYDRCQEAGEIAFVTFHQSYSYEDFIEGIRPVTTDSGNVIYEVQDGILKKTAARATENYQQYLASSKGEVTPEYTFRKLKEALLEKYENNEEIVLELVSGKKITADINAHQTSLVVKPKEMTFHLTFKNLEALWKRRGEIQGRSDLGIHNSSYYYAALRYLEKLAEALDIKPTARQPLKQYIVIIDEINRGNISKIFGEMITLIEPTKRLGREEETRVALPYSSSDGDSERSTTFVLPPNLHLIGTMNTADRSIALLDTALRRRFKFREMMPKPELLVSAGRQCGVDLPKLLTTLNERIESVYDRDHTIGHAYLIHVDSLESLQTAFTETVIPLLQEYFYGNWEKIIWVLHDEGHRFITKTELPVFDDGMPRKKYRYQVVERPDITAFEQLTA